MKLNNRKSVMGIFLSVIVSMIAVEYVSVTQSNDVVQAVRATESTVEVKQNASALYHKLTSLEHTLVGYQIAKGPEYKADGLSIVADINALIQTILIQLESNNARDAERNIDIVDIGQANTARKLLAAHVASLARNVDAWFLDVKAPDDDIIEQIQTAKDLSLKLKGELDSKIIGDVILIGEHAHHVSISAFITFGVTFMLTSFMLWLVFNQNSMHAKNEGKLEKLLYCDHLTGVPNRRAIFDEKVNHRVFPKTATYVGTCMVDIDSFNTTNDTIGNYNGDDIIKQLIARMQGLESVNAVARFGGDEFIVVFDTKQNDYIEASLAAEAFADRFMAELERPFNIKNMPFEHYSLSYGVGITLSKVGSENDDIARRLKEADIALYHSKSKGRGIWSLFKPSMETYINHQLIVERNVREAVDSSAIQVQYQPIIKNAHVVGAESILSWTDQETGIVYQHNELVKMTERLRISTQVGHMNLEQTCRQLRQWILDESVDENFVVSVNISGQQIKDPNFAKSVQEAADKYEIPYHRLRLEIADGVVFSDIKDTLYKLRAMKNLGVIITLDDFGSGFTSLTHLRVLPVTDVKISEAFSSDVHLSKQSYELMKSLHGICKAVNIGAIVDGVEATNQLNLLRDMGFDTFQGQLFGAPVTPHRFIETYLPTKNQEDA